MNVEHIDLFAGEDRTITLHGRDASNNPVSLTGKTVTWYVGPRCEDDRWHSSRFTKAATVTVAASGTFTVPVLPADTADIGGLDLEHMAKATTTIGGAVAVISRGRFRVRPVLIA